MPDIQQALWSMCKSVIIHYSEPLFRLSVKQVILIITQFISEIRAVEIPCPTCPTWSHFIQDKLKISIYLIVLGQVQMYKVNTILYFIF